MKFSFVLTLLMFISVIGYGQTMTISEFTFDESDLTATTSGSIVLDQNGNKCALIKIETTEFGFSFDAGSLGVVKTEQHVGEIWLYIPEGVKRLSISHPKYEKIRDYDLGLSVKKGRTYYMKLCVEKQADDLEGLGSIKVDVKPAGAEVFVDDISLGVAPLTFSQLIPGKHKLTIKHEGYYDYDSNITITEGKVTQVDETLAKSCDIDRQDDRIDITTKGVTFTLLKVKGGDFQMGATKEQGKGKTDEFPIHKVTLSDYYIGETEVTNELWSAIMGSNPTTQFALAKQPVNNVNWYDCQKFVNRLSSLTGLPFSLPTEAQWEYAARGGNKSKGYVYSGNDNIKKVGWYKGNSKYQIKEVKQLQPNELGLYDMSGNVFEWCSDWYGLYKSNSDNDPKGPSSGTNKVNRGGGAGDKEAFARVACRANDNPNYKSQALGLRLVINE